MANYAIQCRNCGGYFSGNGETYLCYSCLKKKRLTREAIDYLEPLIEHPTLTGRFCKYLKFAVEALKEAAGESNDE